MYPIVVSNRFYRDLAEIARYLRREASPAFAERVRDGIVDAIVPLADQPERYPKEPKLAHLGNYRVIRLKKFHYKIFYRFTGLEVRIERVFHAKRDFDRIFRKYKF